MNKFVKIARRLAWRLLCICLKMVKRNDTLDGTNKDMDANCDQPLVAGLVDVDQLPDIKIMGAILNPLLM